MSRRHIVALSGIAALTLPLLLPTASWAAKPEPPAVPDFGPLTNSSKSALEITSKTDSIIVVFDQNQDDPEAAGSEAVAAAAAKVGAKVTGVTVLSDDTVAVILDQKVSTQKAAQISDAAQQVAGVKSSEADPMALPTSNDEFYWLQWNLSASMGSAYSSNADAAWGMTKGNGVRVGVIDTGITPHPDLTGSTSKIVGRNVIAGYDFIVDRGIAGDGNGRDSNPTDPGDWCTASNEASSWHGTHVSGIIGAIADNGIGVTGVAPNVKIQPLRALGHCGGYASDAAAAIRWGAGLKVSGLPKNKKPVKVLNLSLGGEATCPGYMQSAINAAVKKGVTIVVSAGNKNSPVATSWPANCNKVIRVAATGPDGAKADYSNYGTGDKPMTLSAPGGTSACSGDAMGYCIASTWNTGVTTRGDATYGLMVGTSQAAPHVAAVAAELKAVNPGLKPDRIAKILQQTATPANCDASCGAGIVNAGAAVQQAVNMVVNGLDQPKISGKAKVGKKLSTKGKGASGASYRYQWLQNGTAIGGATKATFKLRSGNKGQKISVQVTATYKGATKSRVSKTVKVK